jgi:vitamin B12 transporter
VSVVFRAAVATAAACVLLAASAAPASVIVVAPSGAPLAGATVVFVDAEGRTDTTRSDAHGVATARAGFAPLRVDVSAPGYLAVTTAYPGPGHGIVLHPAPKSLGAIRVATGSTQSLHSLPVAGSYIDRTQVQTSSALTTDALLRALPGFDRTRSNAAFTNYGQLRVSFNGAGNDRGLVLVDGVPAQDGFGGQIDWLAYPAEFLDRAEILRGAGSALYGAGAVGGVLSLATFGPSLAPSQSLQGFVSYAAGSRGTDIADLAVRAPLSPGAAVSVTTNRWRSSYYDFPPAYFTPVATAATSQSNATQVRFLFGGTGSSTEIGLLNADDSQQEGRPNYNEDRAFRQLDARFSLAKDQSLLSLVGYVRDAFVLNVADKYPSQPGVPLYTQHVPTDEAGISASWLVAAGNNDFQARIDARAVSGSSFQYFPSGKLQNAGSGSQFLGGLAVQETFRMPRFEALIGTRADTFSYFGQTLVKAAGKGFALTSLPNRTMAALSPRAALRYALSPAVTLRVSDGTGIRPPYLNELVRGFQIGKTFYAPNANLVPERSATQSGGLDALIGHSRLSLEVFSTKVSDAIAFETISPTLQERANIARTQTDGATLEFDAPLGRCLNAHASGTTQYARVTSGPPAILGKRLAFVPNRSADVGLDGGIGSVQAGIDATFLGQAFADDLNTEPLNPALLLGLRLTAPVAGSSTISLSADNLTDRVYLSSVDRLGPPATYTVRWQTFFGRGAAQAARPSCPG